MCRVSSSPASSRACPCCCGAVRSHGARMVQGCEKSESVSDQVLDFLFPARFLGAISSAEGLCIPGNLLHDVPDECGPLAQVAFHARDSRLRLAGSDFLYRKVSVPLSFACPDFVYLDARWQPLGGRRTWPALRPTAMPDLCLTSFGMVAVVCRRCRRVAQQP